MCFQIFLHLFLKVMYLDRMRKLKAIPVQYDLTSGEKVVAQCFMLPDGRWLFKDLEYQWTDESQGVIGELTPDQVADLFVEIRRIHNSKK